MRKMKKIIAFLLSAVLLVSAQSAFAATAAEDSSLPQFGLLEALGVDVDDSDEAVTRGQFIQTLISFMGFDLQAFTQSSFEDVDAKNTELVSAVEYAVGMNAVSAGQYFYPDREITYAEACKMTVAALGYEGDALRYGGYPSGYLTVASLLSLNKGVSASFTAGDMYRLLLNAAETDIKTVTSYSSEGGVRSYGTDTDKSFLEAYHDVTKVKGVVTAGNGGYLYDSTEEFAKNRVMIGNTEYYLGEAVICPLGYYVTAYVKEDSDSLGETAEVIYADLSKNEVTYIAAEDVLPLNNRSSLPYKDENERTQSIDIDGALVLYNGRACEGWQKSDIEISDGYIEAIDNDRDGAADVVSVWSAAYLEVDYVNRYSDTHDYIFYDKNKANNVFIDLKDMCFSCNTELKNIKSGNILEVFCSKNNDFVKINLLSETVSGTVNGIGTDGSILIGEREIDTASYFDTYYEKELSLGESTTVVLESSGKAVAVTSAASGFMKFAYFEATNEDGALNEDIQLKLFTEDEKVITPKLAEKVVLNGKRETKKDAYKMLSTHKKELIRFHLNEAEELDKVNTTLADEGTYDAAADGANTLKRYRFSGDDTDSTIYYKSFGYFVPHFTLNAGTKIFCVSTNETEDAKRYSIGSLSFLSNDKKVPANTILVYNTDINGLAGALLYASDDASTQSLSVTSSTAVVSKMSTAINEDGEQVFKIRLYASDKYTTLYIKKDASFIQAMNLRDGEFPFGVGDLLRYSADSKGEYMLTAIKDFDGKTRELSYNADDNTELHYYYGQIYAIGESSIAVKKSDGSLIYIPLTVGDAGIVEKDDVITQPKEKISSYVQVGENCHKILIRCRYSSPNQYYIYK